MNPYRNPTRPRGMGAIEPAQPAAPVAPIEEEQIIPLTKVLTSLQSSLDVGVNIDKDSDFWLTHLWGKSTGAYTILLRHHNGRGLSTVPIRSDNLVGTVQFRTPLKPMLFPAGSRISVDLTDTSAAGNTIELCFGGIRRPVGY